MSISIADKQIELDRAKSKYLLFSDAEDRVVRGGQSMTIDDGDMEGVQFPVSMLSGCLKELLIGRTRCSDLTKEIEKHGKKRQKWYICEVVLMGEFKKQAESIYNRSDDNRKASNFRASYPLNPDAIVNPFTLKASKDEALKLSSENAIGSGLVRAMVDGTIGAGVNSTINNQFKYP